MYHAIPKKRIALLQGIETISEGDSIVQKTETGERRNKREGTTSERLEIPDKHTVYSKQTSPIGSKGRKSVVQVAVETGSASDYACQKQILGPKLPFSAHTPLRVAVQQQDIA